MTRMLEMITRQAEAAKVAPLLKQLDRFFELYDADPADRNDKDYGVSMETAISNLRGALKQYRRAAR